MKQKEKILTYQYFRFNSEMLADPVKDGKEYPPIRKSWYVTQN